MPEDLLPGFQHCRLPGAGIEMFARLGGTGSPLLLLHGFPETHVMWHRIAPALAARHAVVLLDLRGYGASGKPPPGPGDAAYAKRAMAADCVAAMQALGFARFAIAGHDRGARVAHRMALDHPERVERLAVLDIVPTLYRFGSVDQHVAMTGYHWFFLAQPGGLPERLIGAEPAFFLRHTLNSWALTPEFWDERAFAAYLAAIADPQARRGFCADYRANATIDLAHDRADRDRQVTCPTLVLWGASPQSRRYDVLEVWRRFAPRVEGMPITSGHFLAEEAPEPTARALLDFFAPP